MERSRIAVSRSALRVARRWLTAALLAGAAFAAYLSAIRPWLLHWGAAVPRASFPGDDLVARPRYVATRGVTIAAPPAAIWPWLVQIGQGRGGFYSYDWLENLVGCDIHSADRILPAFQRLAVGDRVRLEPEGRFDLTVAAVEPERALVLRTPGNPEENLAASVPFASWAFILEPINGRTTRLIARWRADYAPSLAGRLANHYLLEPIHFIMERKMLLGIKARAEREMAASLP